MDDQNPILKTDGIDEQNVLIQDRTVVALFASDDDARNAEQSLIEAGYEKVVVTSNSEAATNESTDARDHGFWASVKAFFGDHKDADLYGEGLRRGQTMVTVHTQQGRAALAVDILDRFNPTDVEGAEQAWQSESEPAAETMLANEVPAEDRPAYLAAAADMSEPEPAEKVIAVFERPISGERDLDSGNARVRSYAPTGTLGSADEIDDVAFRDDDAILSDTDEDALLGDGTEAVSTEELNKAWLGRTHGLEDRADAADSDVASDRDPGREH